MSTKGYPEPRRLFSFRWLMILVVASLSLGAAAVAVGLVGITARSDQAMDAWRTYANRSSDKERQLRNYLMHMGVGGMIDLYKSYVISGRAELAPEIYARTEAALGALGRYRQYGVTDDEAAAVAVLEATVNAYHERVAMIGALHAAGASLERIEERALIDGTPAWEATRFLLARVRAERLVNLGGPRPKPNIVFDLRAALGFQGLSHAYKNLILHSDEVNRRRALRSLAQAREAVEAYRQHPLTSEERAALETIDHILDAYETGASGGMFEELRAEGMGAADIDSASAVLTEPLLDALGALDAAMAREERVARGEVATALSYVVHASKTTATFVIVSVGIMIAVSIWLLGFRVTRRIQRLTKAMRELSQGHVDTVIPSISDLDEIGEMSRTLLVFRDSMEANLMLARELAESSRLASLGALVAGMAHELNTPIGNAVAVASTLGENVRRLSEEAASGKLRRSALGEFIERTRQASALIERNLLYASRQIGSFKQIAVDQTGDQRRAFKLDSALADVVESMGPSARRARCIITLEAEDGIDMDGYPGALTQVVCNLVENSLQHGLADRSGGTIAITARRVDEARSEVTVWDDGVGIPKELQSRIFDAFFTTRAGRGGSGLGLHIVNTLVSGPLGGEVSVESTPGVGTKFTILLPNVAPQRVEGPGQRGDRVYYAAA